MEPLELSLTDVLLRAENGVLEAFYTRWDTSIRVPLAWLAVRPEPQRRGDFVFLSSARGTRRDPFFMVRTSQSVPASRFRYPSLKSLRPVPSSPTWPARPAD